ncbi:PQQ-dependent sugar dehydrogenase [Brevundimonas sp.]|uniref:PQQ-dependent sugar dehydrogenase n=1 Tax=Brevundimonas sp. TaxID=1871086 RepID=UPI0025C43811|nr:PQQ-dependent sugar dehydrogenase [Brevundimonas sp.]
MIRSLVSVAALALACCPATTQAQAPGRPYAVQGSCGGVRATTVRMAENYCLGRVWQRTGGDGPRMPRGLLQLSDTDWLITDLGTWDAGRGALWRMSVRGEAVVWTRLMRGLSMPHTIARGPDGRIYLAEMSRILAFDADRPEAAVAVVDSLPDNRLHENRHPLSSFIFDGDGALLVNVGAPSDRCLTPAGRPIADPSGQCAQGAEQAMVRRYAMTGAGRWSATWTAYSTGLRNSVAMVRHRSGAIYQGENSVDLTTANRPFDEINRLTTGAHYGWPYCTDMATALPGWTTRQARCGQRTPPVSLLPPHAAPLAMLYYDGAMFPELRGRMLMSWHGHRQAAGRIVAIETDANGAPLTETRALYAVYPRGALAYPSSAPAPRARVLTPGWNAVAGSHPMGAPVGMAVARDGSIWVVDDRNAAILRIARP